MGSRESSYVCVCLGERWWVFRLGWIYEDGEKLMDIILKVELIIFVLVSGERKGKVVKLELFMDF